MKTSLKFLSLFLAASVPSALAVEFAGVALPAGLDATSIFGAFVVALLALIAFTDYARSIRPLTLAPARPLAAPTASSKAAHPLAA